MFIHQLCIGSLDNFTYLIGCVVTKEALVIDPAGDPNPVLDMAEEEELNIKYILNTHGHFDHTAGNARLKFETGSQLIIHKGDAEQVPDADLVLDKETTLQVGVIHFDIIHTPGHTPGGICLYAQGSLFTGDTLFVGDSGRTNMDGGDRLALGASIRKLMELPDDTVVFPGHDYGPTQTSTIGWEKRNNVNAKEYGFYVGD
ncbi:MBL fold metallo-hydrolase [candidate division KSB1 bacterium]|nr:MBL fold metallo-hydrolase [candidate division KSB1 bacterium]